MSTVATPQIVLDEAGVAWIESTKTKVIEVALAYEATGLTAKALQKELSHLTTPQIEAALAYYDTHRDELEADIARRQQWVREFRATQPEGPTRADLLSRLKDNS